MPGERPSTTFGNTSAVKSSVPNAMTLVLWLRRHPLLGYFALTYGVSWGGIFVVLGATGFDLAVLRPLDTGLIGRSWGHECRDVR